MMNIFTFKVNYTKCPGERHNFTVCAPNSEGPIFVRHLRLDLEEYDVSDLLDGDDIGDLHDEKDNVSILRMLIGEILQRFIRPVGLFLRLEKLDIDFFFCLFFLGFFG
mmetsp:Transcript_23299/g.53207  ORF Transcript_23299/g.53207 Transcript_23299/m.53207 type:complete len:108 (-) Transcript_23299:360-683(-)